MRFSRLLPPGTSSGVLLVLLRLSCFAAPPTARQEPRDLPQSPGAAQSGPTSHSVATNPITVDRFVPTHRFWDRTNILLFAGIGITRGMDYASTRNFQARGRDEILIPDDVVNNSAGFAGLEAAGTATSIGISYLLHRTGHHTLERWMSVGHISVTGFGDVRNYCLKTRRTP